MNNSEGRGSFTASSIIDQKWVTQTDQAIQYYSNLSVPAFSRGLHGVNIRVNVQKCRQVMFTGYTLIADVCIYLLVLKADAMV